MNDDSTRTVAIPHHAWKRLAACVGAAALLQIDGTLITVALPSMGRDLDVGSHTVSWALTTYFAAYAVALFPGGRLTDSLGSRSMAFWGLSLFALGALLGALAGSFELLIASRIVQGAGAGLVSPASLAGAVSAFPPERRGTALGIWGAGSGLSNIIGPLLGGILVDAGGWRACWWALLPLSAAALYGFWRSVPREVHQDERPEVGILLNRTVAAAAMVAALTFAVMIGAFFLAQLYLQKVARYSGFEAGAALILVALAVGAAAPLAGRLSDRKGESLPALLGFALAAVGLVALGIPGAPLEGVGAAPLLLLVGAGLGLLFTPASRAALNAVPQARHGRVSSVLSACRLAGAALGSWLAGVAVATGVTSGNVQRALLIAAAICVLLGMPSAAYLSRRRAQP